MPSGAKKRKAAKKKKEIESSTSSNNPQGENELKSIDEKGSDGGEGDSPRNHDDDHNQFNEGSDEGQEIEPLAAVVKSTEEEVRKDSKVDEAERGKESVDVIEWDMKSDESSENKDVSVVQIESAEELNNGSGNSGCSKDVIETGTSKNLKDESYNSSGKETAAFDEETVSSVKESVNSVAESSAGSVNVVTSVSEVQSGDTGNNLLEKSLVSQGAETDLAGKRDEDKVHVLPDENVKTSSSEEPETREFDGKVSSSPVSQSPITESTNGVEHAKDSNTAESSEYQPLVASAPHMVHKTSWLSCCGLFEVLSSSNR